MAAGFFAGAWCGILGADGDRLGRLAFGRAGALLLDKGACAGVVVVLVGL